MLRFLLPWAVTVIEDEGLKQELWKTDGDPHAGLISVTSPAMYYRMRGRGGSETELRSQTPFPRFE